MGRLFSGNPSSASKVFPMPPELRGRRALDPARLLESLQAADQKFLADVAVEHGSLERAPEVEQVFKGRSHRNVIARPAKYTDAIHDVSTVPYNDIA